MIKKENRLFSVYKHTTPCGKVYIGITSQRLEKRWQNGNGYIHNDHFTKAIKRYGWQNIKHDVLFENLTIQDAYKKEIELISYYKSNDPNYGYNNSSGGEGANGIVMSESAKQKLREKSIGRHLSEEAKQKVSKFNKGKKQSEETKRKISEALKGKPKKGHPLTNEAKRKISIALKGKKKPHKGIPRSEEARMKMRLANANRDTSNLFRRSIMCIETGIIYPSITDAAKQNNVDRRNISRYLSKQRIKTSGLSWKYCDDKTRQKDSKKMPI